jgi:hypothetical protein
LGNAWGKWPESPLRALDLPTSAMRISANNRFYLPAKLRLRRVDNRTVKVFTAGDYGG